MNLNTLSPIQKRELFERDQRIEAVVSKLVADLVSVNYKWSDEDSKAADWVLRNLKHDLDTLSMAA